MNSQINNSNDKNDQVFQEDTPFRQPSVFLDSSSKRNSASSPSDQSKRVRLDAAAVASSNLHRNHHNLHQYRRPSQLAALQRHHQLLKESGASSASTAASNAGSGAGSTTANGGGHAAVEVGVGGVAANGNGVLNNTFSMKNQSSVNLVPVQDEVDPHDTNLALDSSSTSSDASANPPTTAPSTNADNNENDDHDEKTNDNTPVQMDIDEQEEQHQQQQQKQPEQHHQQQKQQEQPPQHQQHQPMKKSLKKLYQVAPPAGILKKYIDNKPLTNSNQNKAPKYIRRFRSRSLPIITYQNPTNRSHVFQHHIPNSKVNTTTTTASSSAHHHHHHQSKPKNSSNISLPPINLQSLKEIDLHEILKNPQLRHDILFDPQLQFRPNLDGERGRRKKTIIDKYWNEIEKECKQFFIPNNKSIRINSLPILFTTLRDILLSLLPYKDRSAVNEIMDIDLLIQQLNHGSFDFVNLAKWLGEVFKSHCAPMRDQWVSDMILKFVNAYETNSVEKLVQGLRMIFSILEAMKLDVANHQIRILRPVLTETAVDFEKDYFNQLINHCKIDINDSLKWFDKNVEKKKNSSSINHFLNDSNDLTSNSNLKILITSSIIDLLSCRNMATEFPSTLAFDHTRLVLLRADVRQLVCVQLCVVLYKQLLLNYSPSSNYRNESFKPSNINKVQEEILAIVTDDNGNVKWTRNVQAISLQLVKNATTNPLTNESVKLLPKSMIEFSCNWLIKQIQPSSEVYGLMEDKIFKELLKDIITNLEFENSLINSNPDQSNDSNKDSKKINSESNNIALRISTLVKFHWNVFGNYYTDYLKNSSK